MVALLADISDGTAIKATIAFVVIGTVSLTLVFWLVTVAFRAVRPTIATRGQELAVGSASLRRASYWAVDYAIRGLGTSSRRLAPDGVLSPVPASGFGGTGRQSRMHFC